MHCYAWVFPTHLCLPVQLTGDQKGKRMFTNDHESYTTTPLQCMNYATQAILIAFNISNSILLTTMWLK